MPFSVVAFQCMHLEGCGGGNKDYHPPIPHPRTSSWEGKAREDAPLYTLSIACMAVGMGPSDILARRGRGVQLGFG